MHYNRRGNDDSRKEYRTKRGTSKLEGYHAHLHDVLSGNNYSGELAHVLIMFFNFKWNIRRGVENLQWQDFISCDLWRLENINKAATSLGLPAPHLGLQQLQLVPSTQELFGTKYKPPETDLDGATKEVLGRTEDDNEGMFGMCPGTWLL